MVKIGYACLTRGVPDTGFKSCIMKNATEDRLRELISHNLGSLENIIDYNIKNDILLFRITSEIIPFGSSPVNRIEWEKEFEERFNAIGNKIKDSGMRVSMHPGQYTVLNSPKEDVVERAVRDLEYHEKFLSALGTGASNKIILHLGGVYNDKKKAVERFDENYMRLDREVRERLVLENDDRSYTVEEVLEEAVKRRIPVVYDNLHNEVNHELEKEDRYWIKTCRDTWKAKDGNQKIHYSQQDESKQPGAHTQTIRIRGFMNFYTSINDIAPDIMLEVKDKNISAVKCLNCAAPDKRRLQMDWARHKYPVMEKSQAHYKAISHLFHENNYPAVEFYETAENAYGLERSVGNEKNAAMHVWGYFKDSASKREYEKFQALLGNLEKGAGELGKLKRYLYSLSKKYDREYLLDSYYFADIN